MAQIRGAKQRQKKGRSGRRKHKGPRHDPHYYTQAGPVTIRKADGSVETQRPYSKDEFQRICQVRANVSPGTAQKIFTRDKGTCRYCGDTVGPFDIDHVVPIAMGGSNRFGNLVTACCSCNRRKGANVWKLRPIRG